MTALLEKEPVTGIDETNDPKTLASERATSSCVGLIPLPPKALEMATLPSTAIIGTKTTDDPNSPNCKGKVNQKFQRFNCFVQDDQPFPRNSSQQ